MSYYFSRDYERLYNLIVQGFIAVGFVDYNFHNSNTAMSRDVCKIKITGDDRIEFGVRGYSYGRSDFDINNFIKECERLTLDWIEI
jgi:hypothetical protein